jgi:hypothetical protein
VARAACGSVGHLAQLGSVGDATSTGGYGRLWWFLLEGGESRAVCGRGGRVIGDSHLWPRRLARKRRLDLDWPCVNLSNCSLTAGCVDSRQASYSVWRGVRNRPGEDGTVEPPSPVVQLVEATRAPQHE